VALVDAALALTPAAVLAVTAVVVDMTAAADAAVARDA
jgi:hypothetical protein